MEKGKAAHIQHKEENKRGIHWCKFWGWITPSPDQQDTSEAVVEVSV